MRRNLGTLVLAFLLLLYSLATSAAEPVKDFAARGYRPIADESVSTPGPMGNLDSKTRHFGILKAADVEHQRVTLLIDGETDAKEWEFAPGAELWIAGWWGRLDQFTVGDRVWIWFEMDKAKKQPVMVSLLADELSEQDLYAAAKVKAVDSLGTEQGTVTLETAQGKKAIARTLKPAKAELYRGSAKAPLDSLKVGEKFHVQSTGDNVRLMLDSDAFDERRDAQKAILRQRWADEGLPGTLIFAHPERNEVELMLDHESMRWGRSLRAGDKVTLQAGKSVSAVVRQLRPWWDRTQVLLAVEGTDTAASMAALTVGQRVPLRLAAIPEEPDDDQLPTGLGRSLSKSERVEWLMASIYCTCGMHDQCAGHFFTFAACSAGPKNSCGLAKSTREEIAEKIDKGQTDQQIFEELLKDRGPKLLRPHMSP